MSDDRKLSTRPDVAVRANIRAHNRVYRRYEIDHVEIYNEVEQDRLHRSLVKAIALISTSSPIKSALDYGCGGGNLTKHFREHGLRVTAADVSRNFLDLVRERYGPEVRTVLLNGRDLSNIEDSFDVVSTYSVLHHVPDYLQVVRELARRSRPGGIVYIDHEVLEIYIKPDAAYSEFRRLAMPMPPRTWHRFLKPSRYWGRLRKLPLTMRLWINPRYMPEGDIHIWPDDHIEWDKIEQVLIEEGCTVVMKEDYLSFRPYYVPEVYESYRDRLCDMRVLVARKGG